MNLILAAIIHLAVPAAGLGLYLWLCQKMGKAQISQPPYIPFFLVFAHFGGWLLIALTLSLWYWSGLATLGLAYLAVVSPAVMLAVCVWMFVQRKYSRFHRAALFACLAYLIMVVFVVGGTLTYQLLRPKRYNQTASAGKLPCDRFTALVGTSNYRFNPTPVQQVIYPSRSAGAG